MDAREVELIYELSPMQQAMLFHSLYAPGTGVYVIQQSLRLTGPLDVPALERAWRSLVDRHGILRTAFFWEDLEKPLQVVHRQAPFTIVRESWRGLSADGQRERLRRALAEDRERGFDLGAPPLFRLALYELDEDVHQLVWSYHHLLSDGWSQGLLLRELFAAYAAYAQGSEPALPKPRPFRDYIAWLQRQDLETAEAFWRGSLAGFTSPTFVLEPEGRTEGPRPEDSRRAVLALSPGASTALREVARRHRLTLNTLVQGAWALLLSRMTGAEDVVFGTTVSGRPADLPGVEQIIGLFINTLPVRMEVRPEQRLREWLAGLQQRQVEIRRFEHSPLVEVQRWSGLPAGTPLFDHILVFENLTLPGEVSGGIQGLAIQEESATTSTNYPLNVVVIPGSRLTLTALYDAARFHGAEVTRLLERLTGILTIFTADQDPRLGNIPVLLEAERQQALVEWNDTRSAYPDEASLPELFAAVARRHPEAPAVIGPAGEVWSYRRLDEESSRLARRLLALGVTPESAVGISMESSAELIAGTLAILKAGGVYVPLDAAYPDARLGFLLADTGTSTVLVHAATRGRLAGLASVLDVDDPDWRSEPATAPGVRVPAGSLAYVIYTSGSTGRPKGVAVPHRAVARLVLGTDYVRLGPGDRTAQAANTSFDAATYEIWGALLTGAAVAVIPRGVALSPTGFAAALRERGVTSLFLTSALFARMAREVPDAFAALSELMTGGEAVDPAAARAVLAGGPPRRLIDVYGPTESTTFATWHRIAEPPQGAIPIGRPIANTTLYVLDRHSEPVPPGSPGELCIGGDGLARGYLNRPELTAGRFVPHPWPPPETAGARLYRTGDLVRQRADGAVEYLGRLDHQVKIRGFRIEPGEIEAVLATRPEVRECAVLASRSGAGEIRLVAYIATGAATGTDAARLRSWLQERLPDYMVPAAWVVLDALPLNANGKVDRAALPAPERSGSRSPESAPSDAVEARLAEIWAEVLGLERVGVHDDFFALGGHSLLATQVVSRVRAAFAVDLPLRDLFESPTVAGLARAVREARGPLQEGPLLAAAPAAETPEGRCYPLSFAQQRLWLIDQLEPESPLYNVPLALRLAGDLPVPLLRRVCAAVIARHDALRTTFTAREGVPLQVVAPADAAALPELPLADLSALPAAAREEQALALAREEARRPFDLRRGPLLRLALLRLGARDHLLLATLHHIVSDGWSLGVLLREVAALYAAFSQGLPSPLAPLPVQYADFAHWQRGWLRGEALEAQLGHWRRQLAGAPAVLELPTDRPRPPVRSQRGATLPVRLPAALSEAAATLGRREGATPFMVLLAAWGALLGRHAGQEDVLVGTPIAGRHRREIEDLIGFFVNTLVLRVDAQGSPGFGALLARVRQASLDAFAHQDLPFERLVEELVPERDLAVPPLFQTMFVLQNTPVGELALPGLTLTPVPVANGLAKLDLTLALSEGAEGAEGALEHDTDLFDTVTLERLWARFGALLEAAVADPGRPVGDLPSLLPAERHQALLEWNDTASGYPREASVPELFAAVARRAPEALALLSGEEVWTYGRLDAAAHRLARHLAARGVTPGTPVGISLRRSAELILGLLAILRAGGVYVPLDAGYPDERLSFMVADAALRLVLVHAGTRERLERLGPRLGLDLVAVDGDGWREGAAAPLPESLPAESLAYVVYTSGSTGRPKGVAVPHRAIARLTRGTDYVRLGPDDGVAHASNTSFDAATFEIWGALLNGAAVVVVPREVSLAPAELARFLRAERVTALFLTTALFNQVVREEPAAFAGLRHLLFGGEAVDPGVVERLLRSPQNGPERLLHVYGPTESTTFATWHRVAAVAPGAATVPIGLPLANTTLWVIDRRQTLGQPVPPGSAGELCVGGDGLAWGYWNRPELTAERFVPHPWGDGERLYRTGDRVRQRRDGAVEFLGRFDDQVKIRGFRIEPGEVEAVLAGHPEVREQIVLARDGRLIAWVVPAPGVAREGARTAVRSWLAERLPDHMVPSAVVVLDALPLTPNGKVDRRALPAPDAAGPGEAGYRTPSDPAEELLAGIWAEVLGVERVGVDDDFFALGGHSLLATQVMSRLRAALGVELPLRRLFEAPTVAQLARDVRGARQAALPPLLPVPREGDPPLSFAQQRLWLIDQLDPGSAAYNVPLALRLRGEARPALLERIFAAIAARHEVLRTTFVPGPEGPVQVIAPAGGAAPALPRVDLSALPPERREAVAHGLAHAEALRPFDLLRGPVLRLLLLRLGEREHVLLQTVHHIAADGWSMGVLLREVAALYEAFGQGLPAPLPALPVQYADFAVWQRSWMRGEALRAELDHWTARLDGAPRVLELPTDRPRPAQPTWRGAARPVSLSPALSEAVGALCRRQGTTPFMVLLAAWGALLGRHAGQPDLLVGTPVAGRNRRETEGLIGFFVNTLVLRVNAAGSPRFGELLDRVRAAALDAFAHQDVPFERLVEELVPERDLALSPLFQVMFALQNAPLGELALPGLSLAPLAVDARVAKFDLTLTLAEGNGGVPGVFGGSLEHSVDLFDGATAARLWDRFTALLEAAVAAPETPVADLPLLLPAELHQALVEPKVDRQALPAPGGRPDGGPEADAPAAGSGDPLEELMAALWAELLGVERVGRDDDFFALGGHSLLATQVLSRVRELFGVELPLRRLFATPTVAALAALVREAQGGAVPAAVLSPRSGALPLSFAQQRLWLIDQLDPDNPAYNMPFPVRLRGAVAPGLLARIFAEVVARHEALRTTFATVDGEPVQVIAAAADAAPELPLVDLSALPEAGREAAARDLVLADALRPFDLRRGPLLRLALLRLAAGEHVLLVTMHHIVSDGWSLGVLLREVAALYAAFAQGLPSPLPALPLQYADFAVWQREWLRGGALGEQLEHWRQRLAGAPGVLELPTDRPRPAVQTFRGASRAVALPPALSAAVRELCRKHRVTPFMALLATWGALLGRHAGQRDVLLGTPVAGRNRREVEGLIGFFVNTLVLRVDLRGAPDLAGLLERVREASLDAFSHQDLPFERLVEELVPQRDLATSPLFQAMFALQNAPVGELALPGLSLAPVAYENRIAKFDLSLALGERGGLFHGSLDHNLDLFDGSTAARLWARFEALLRAAAADPARPVADLPLLLPAELHQVLVETNADRGLAPPPSVPELFLERAAAAPEAPALVFAGAPDGSLTYGELERRSARLARHLRGLGVGPEVRVAVCAGRSPHTLLALLAVLRAGGAYLPLDPAWPADRMAWMLEDAGAALVLTDRETAGRLPPLADDRTDDRIGLLFLEDEPADRPDFALEPPLATQAAYVIYTSGSTGRPKGVVALHGGLAAFSRALADAMELAPGDRVLQYASLSFDASAVEIWPALIRGAAVAVHPDPTALSAREMLALAAGEGWTVVNLPAAPWRQMVQDVDGDARSFPPCVRLFITGGESLSPEVLRQWRRVVAPEARLLSCYGPTETTVIVSVYEASAGRTGGAPAALGAPLGSMLPGTALSLLDERLAPVPLDVPGEVFLGGPWVTRGYLGRPGQTAAVFLPDPWGPPGARLYRTGDRARLRPDGGLEFLGRIDHQVKIRGFRVEPGEIETVLAGHPAVRECAVLARRDGGSETRLVAYAVLQPEAGLDDPGTALRAWLRERLPEALVPSAFVLLDAFPTSTSGKIDRQALPAPERPRGLGGDHVPPGDPLEKALAAVWEELLGVERVGVHDDFFALGGHSLLATRVLSRVRDLFGVELPLRRLFSQPTVAALARLVREAQREEGGRRPPIVPVPREDWPRGLPLSFAQQRLWFLEQLEPGNAAYHMPQAVRLTGRVSADLLERLFATIVERHEALRTTFVSHGEQPAQVIAPVSGEAGDSRPLLRVVDLSGLPEAEREERALALARQEAARPFDLRTGPLLRQTLVRLAPEDHLLLLNLHHIVSDGWSMGVLIGEIAELYRAFSGGEAPRLPALPVQYADYAVWQRAWLQGEVLAAELAWWREQLAGLPPLLELPTDRPRPPVQSFRGGQLPVRLPAALSDRLRALAHREGATLFMALLAGFQALLARCGGQDQIAVGSPIAGRNHLEIESLIGFFVNTLVLRGDLSGAPGFRELLGRARERALGAFAHQEVPFEKLVEELAPERSLAHAPLFQAMLVLQNTGEAGLALEGLRLRPVETGSVGAKFDLTLSLQEHAGEILGGLTYATDLFDAATQQRFLDRFERLLAAALDDPAAPWSELPLLSPAEAGQLLDWNDTAAPIPPERLLHERIADRAAETPEREAVVAPDGRLSFAALDRRANQLARHLIALGVAAESRVALCMERSADLVVGLLAALKAGAAFVVVDPAQPLPRLSRVLRDAAPAAVLTREPAASGLPEDLEAPVIRLDQAVEVALESAEDPRLPVDPEQAAYVVYTSGSTGTPKGVVIRHGAVLNLLAALERTVYAGAEPGLRVSVNAPLSFDGAIKQVIQLAQGRTLCLVPDEVRADAAALGRFLATHRVDVLDCTPAQLRALLESEAPLPARLLAGGEAVDQALWDRLARLPGTASFNVYGPSECTVDTTARRIAPDAPRPVLGRPLVNVRTHVMSAALLPQPPGLPGELWIGGAGVARGYLGRPDLTAERFVPDPFSLEPGARLYRTGDLVRWLSSGELEFLGRTDHQVKVRGFRIELGEIEAILGLHPAVRDSVVLVREEKTGDRRLVAWVALQDGDSASPADLTAWLRDRLPAYMVPASFGVLGALPLTANGKVDRRALAALAPESPAGEDRYVPPADPVEEMLAAVWAEVLGVERVGSRDSFFELGGHSLLATRVTSRIRERLGVELPLRALFESPTLADLARAVRAAREPGAATPPLLPVPAGERGATFPLSFAQQRLWFLDQIEPGNPAYAIPLPVRVRGELAPELLERVLSEVVARHEALRTTFALHEGTPVQVVHPDLRPEVRLFDLSDLPEAEREERARRLVADEARRPFDLAAGPLVRLALARLGARDQILLLTLHHIVSDGWSTGVLLREVGLLIEAFRAGRPSPLPPLSLQYPDYAVWQRGWLQGDVLRRQIDPWKGRLAGAPQVLELPTDRPRPPVQTFRGAASPVALPAALAEGVRALCRREGTTPFMALLAAWAVLLGRHAGQDDLLLGSPIAGRNRRETEELIGLFINTLVLRADLREESGPLSFRALLGRVRETALDAFAHQEVPFERLVEELVEERNLAVSPLFQVLFTLQNTPRAPFQPAGLTLEPVEVESGVAKVDLSLTLSEGPAGIVGALEHNTDLFDTATAGRLAARFGALLEAAAADPGRALGDLPLLLPDEQEQALSVWNPASPPATASSLHDLISRQALRRPDAVAVSGESGELTYAALEARSNQMAHHLLALGVTAETPVGVRLERSPGLLVALLGILKAGGAYVPLDPSWPAERTAFVLAAAGASLVLDHLPETGHLPSHSPGVAVDPGQLAYVLFTSGSTGAPKGVMVRHASVARYLEWCVEAYGLAPGRRSLLHSPLGFDLTVTALFGPLLAGGEVRLMPESAGVEAIQELARALGGQDVQLLKLTPAHLEILGNELTPEAASRVATLVVGGDALRGAALGVWRTGAPGTLVVNEYGPTEATVGCCVHAAPAGETGDGRVLIGHPIDGARLHVVDRYLQLLPPGARGELLIGGDGLARGYLGRPDLTAERFLPDPWATRPGDRLYRTGDLVARKPDGSLDFLGRNDHQVKVRGFRIELGEIEAVLGRYPGIREVVVTVREDVPGDRQLAAYVVLDGEAADVEGLRRFAAERLPSYMVPAAIVPLPALPLTPNGKVDRKALPAPERVRSGPAFVGPRDALELEITRLWEELLNVRPVGVRDDFFALGGHSLLAAQLTARLRMHFGREVPLVALLRAPTVERLAVLLRGEAGPEPQGSVVELGAGCGAPLFLVHPVGGEVLSYVPLARALAPGIAVYGLRMPDGTAPPETIEEMAAGYLREIRQVQPEGPYTLGGWSLGGVVAFEMARQLEARGESVDAVVLIDSFAPGAAPAGPLSEGALVAAFAVDLARGLGIELAGPPVDLDGLEPDKALRRLAERAEAAGLLPPGLHLADLERRFARFAANLRAVERYAGGASGARLLLVRASDRPAGMAPPPADLGWNRLARRPVEVHELPGDHYRLVQEPAVGALATLVCERLAPGSPWNGLLPSLPDIKTDEILQMEGQR